ncbi:cobalamin B12-binding domain protein [Desulfovibrio sp. X2]|uniref:B12-binding domain-containing radical SAM protein n=1 Tax=Desulfovibrio sp. X2 TaxID=941449 RepID=UPI000358A6B2|nr:B12-binding domain-containing radical SAM protein [Desulfovibrio sp. X2]EPR41626.1 cobalamin B12-binding domain protein [Desulfovibrio sp. X2]
MRMTLAFPPFHLGSLYNLPPLGIINLATVLRGRGHEAAVLDFVLDIRRGRLAPGPDMYRDCARSILDTEPDAAAFSAQCATYPALVRIARELKRLRPSLPVIVGGHNATFVDRETLAAVPEIDIVARGEGEETVCGLADALAGARGSREWPEALTGVRGLTFRAADGAVVRTPERALLRDLDALPLPDYSVVQPLSAYREACGLSRSIAVLEVGRGCPHACVYCSESAFWRRRVRTFSPGRIVSEMRHLRDGHGADCFVLSFDQFTADREFVRAFCERVMEEGLHEETSWYCISRLDTVDDALLGLMREAGLESMCYGIDSGSARTLSFINKRIDPDLLQTRVAETTKHGIVPTLSFIVGFPDEERADVDATLLLALACAVQGNVSPLLQMPTVLAGTKLHRDYADRLAREVDTYFALGLEFDHGRRLAEDEALIASNPALFSSFYNLPCAGMELAELGRLSDAFPLLLNLYPRTFLLLCLAGRAVAAEPAAADTTAGGSPSLLFAAFLDFVAAREREQRGEGTGTEDEAGPLTARQCFEHFGAFAQEIMDRAGLGFDPERAWAHVLELARYESAGIRAARPRQEAPGHGPGAPGASGAPRGPLVQQGVLVQRFSCDIPQVIEDMRAGLWREAYPAEPVNLAFAYRGFGAGNGDGNGSGNISGDISGDAGGDGAGGELEVVRLNDFGRMYLELCDGRHAVPEIAALLRPLFGEELSPSAFAQTCEDAARTFRSLRFVTADSITQAMEDTPC